MRKLFVAAIALLASTSVLSADNVSIEQDGFFGDQEIIEVKFGGWSKHDSDKLAYMDLPLNESHMGLGLEYYRNVMNSDNHWLGAGAWYMKDSFDSHSIQLSVAYKYSIHFDSLIDSVDLNLSVGAVNRTFRKMFYLISYSNEADQWDRSFQGYSDSRQTQFIAMPMVTVNVTEHIQAEFTYLPQNLTDTFDLFFFRLGYRF